MLEQLSVRNFAIIESIDIDFSPGMTVFSGETGTGKSLIVDALGFLLGARVDNSIIREGATECAVSGLFSASSDSQVGNWLKENGIEWQPNEEILLRRVLKQNGRTLAWIQDRQVSRNELLEFTQNLVDIHGQHEHQRLIDSSTHLDMLDAYAGLEDELRSYQKLYLEWREAARQLQELLEQKAKRTQEVDYLDFVIRDIASIKPKPNEDNELLAEEKILSEHEKLFGAVSEALMFLDSDESADVLHALKKVRANIETARTVDIRLGSFSERLSTAYYELEDVSESLNEYKASLRFDPDRLESIERRLADLQRLKHKYGPKLDDVLQAYERARRRLESLEHAEENAEELEKKEKTLEKEVFNRAYQLSEKRMIAAVSMSSSIKEIVKNLGMPEAQVNLRLKRIIDERGEYRTTPRGIDEAEFFIAPNPGEPELPLSRIASGGELSRFALAIKAVLASKDEVETLVFDEIDSGIGGQVGVAVGEYLKQLSQYRQVLCVTHLATIAVQADHQGKVDKSVSKGRTGASIRFLSGKERETEIARMLSGSSESEVSRIHAAELLKKAISHD